jgi:hypothetical protein
VNRSVATIAGLAIVAGAAIFIGRAWLKPASERAEARKGVLSGAYDARTEYCDFLQDSELPEGLEPPDVGSDLLYLRVVVLFPEVATINGKAEDYELAHVNGDPKQTLAPVHSSIEAIDEGVLLTLTFASDASFDSARLMLDETMVVENVGDVPDN